MSRKEFLETLDLRQDELDKEHRADLMETALRLMLYNPTWGERVWRLQREWSRIHTSQEMKRREMKGNNPCPGDCDVCYKKNCLERRCEPDE